MLLFNLLHNKYVGAESHALQLC